MSPTPQGVLGNSTHHATSGLVHPCLRWNTNDTTSATPGSRQVPDTAFVVHDSLRFTYIMFITSVTAADISVIAVLLTVWFLVFRWKASSNYPFPPGPPCHWPFGTELPEKFPFLQYEEWAKTYGPIFSLRKGTQTFIVIGRYDAAVEIMENQWSSLMDRPRLIAASDIMSGGMRILFLSSGPRLRRLHKALHLNLQTKKARTYEGIQLRNAKNFILDILDNPSDHITHARRYAASVIMTLTYGKTTPTSYTDPEIQLINRNTVQVARSMRPGAYLVDSFPILRYIPTYLRELRAFHECELDLFKSQIDIVRAGMASGKDTLPSFAKFLIKNQTVYGLSDNEAAYLAGSMFGAGSDTTASAISIVIMALACYPETAKKARVQIDALLGPNNRYPTLEDRDQLTEVTAFVLETYRWRPISITGVPHRASKDIIWNGYVIPKGSIVIPNHWSIFRDPKIFPNPEVFDPQRWLTPDGTIRDDIKNYNFGFGRRVCPGMHVANRSLFVNTALLMWAFDISAENVNTMGLTDSPNMRPLPFNVVFEPRLDVGVLRKLMKD
ncbi:cytochrome P450 [Guyanagaster necrorhizus]|uniref:Cytochrome P450 n=1 Tax=Guyanagaster necrorhizus TaxID=856835 RepID=A0A9P7VFX2_9AGAR|nr:cytochrome P450 [Guyanagaster necrorhizus MCA 3950]KAG7439842.1 cytochrome P450 [Guyanagaster necrorhizus MCA 3950]